MFFQVPVNYLAILLCGVVAMVVGFVWYGPLFGKPWMKMIGLTDKKMEEMKKMGGMGKTYGLSFLSSLVMAWFLAHVIWYAAPGAVTLFIAVKTAFYMWLGFVATTGFIQYLYAITPKPYKLYLLETGYHLATLLVMSVVIFFVR